MTPFEYVLPLVSVLVGLALADVAVSLHRLLRARQRVQWDGLALVAAALAALTALQFWWSFYNSQADTFYQTLGGFLPFAAQLLVLFLVNAASLPDEVPDDGLDLRAFYDANGPYFWSLYAVLFLLLTAHRIGSYAVGYLPGGAGAAMRGAVLPLSVRRALLRACSGPESDVSRRCGRRRVRAVLGRVGPPEPGRCVTHRSGALASLPSHPPDRQLPRPMIQGISHITLAVAHLDRAIRFYADTLGCRLDARWDRGAYFSAGELWIALALDPGADPASGETHTAFSVAASDFDAIRGRILASGATEWRENRSEGASVYFLDPDGHQLEVHVGTLASRLAARAGHTADG